jgi:hypothetical protein
MASSMISAALVAQPQLRDDILIAVSGEPGQALHGTTAEATVTEPGTTRTVRVLIDAGVPDMQAPSDVLMLMCAAGDMASVRSLNDRVWRVMDVTPHWQPVVLAVVHTDATTADQPSATSSFSDASGSMASTFVGAVREIEARLERDRRFTGRVDLTLTEDAAHVSTASLGGAEHVMSLPDALHHCVELVKTPTHVIWDRRAEVYTLTGQQALKRAFWLLDQDMDGCLSDAEVILWYNKMFDTASDADVAAVRQHLKDAEAAMNSTGIVDSADAQRSAHSGRARFVTDSGVLVDGFLEACRTLLRDGRSAVVWALLWDTGVGHDGLPYAPDTLDRAPFADHTQRVQLSANGSRFFSGLYTSQRGPRVRDLWEFTPECPFHGIPGLAAPADDGSGLSASDFLQGWKALAVFDPRAVIEFAMWWGYKGDPALLFVLKPSVDARESDRDWPSTLRVMVIGSSGCGKSSLLQHLSAPAKVSGGAHEDEGHSTQVGVRGPLVRAITIPRAGTDVTLLLEEVPEADVRQILASPEAALAYDGAMVCFAPSSDRSMDFLYEVVPELAAYPQLPVTFTLTMTDVPFSDTPRAPAPDAYLAAHGFAWCPFTTSSYPERSQLLGIGNDVDALPATLLETLYNAEVTRVPVVTTARKIRRVLVVTVGIAVVGLTLRRLFRRKAQ